MFFRSIFSLPLHASTDLESRPMLTQNAFARHDENSDTIGI